MHHHDFHHRRGKRFAHSERHHEHGRRHGGGRSGERDLRRFFAHGDLRLVILRLIADKPRHGYEIIKEIEVRVAGAYSPSPGVIYPTLTLLDELGYIVVSPGEGARKLHEITDAGRAFLTANGPAVEALFARMRSAGQERRIEPAPQIVRALENLKFALRSRLNQGPLSEAQVSAIATAVDAAAAGIEQA